MSRRRHEVVFRVTNPAMARARRRARTWRRVDVACRLVTRVALLFAVFAVVRWS